MTRELGGRYDLGDPQRRTAFGQVRFGTRRCDGAAVAAEVLDEGVAADPAVRLRCAAGAAALCAASGRHLVPVQAVVVAGDGVAIVRERVGGTDLPALRAEAGGTLGPREAVALVVDVLDALSGLHAALLVHGALTERDVLVDLDVPLRPVTRLTGWGTAALVRGPGEVVPAADVAAAGRVLCVLLSGAPHLPAGLPPTLTEVVARLLDPDPAGRPTAARARDALDAVAGLRGLAALPPAGGPTGLAALLAPDAHLPEPAAAPPAAAHPETAAPAPTASWSPRAEPDEPEPARPLLVLPRRPGRTTGDGPQWAPLWSGAARRRALVVLPLSVALGAGVTAVAAATAPDAPTARPAPVTASAVPVASYSFPPLLRPDGLRVERTWVLWRDGDGLVLRAATLVRNGPLRGVGAGIDEVVPRSVAADVRAVRFVPEPSTVLEGERVVRHLRRLEPGATTGWRYEVALAAGTDEVRLRELARDAEVARLVWESTRPTPARTPVPAVPAGAGAPPAEVVPEPVRTTSRPRSRTSLPPAAPAASPPRAAPSAAATGAPSAAPTAAASSQPASPAPEPSASGSG